MSAPLTPLDDRCRAISDDGYRCILSASHQDDPRLRPHMRRPCDGTCDLCECDFWVDYSDMPGYDGEEVEP